jgi:clan AA aspartic protease (TIGR02281 family)
MTVAMAGAAVTGPLEDLDAAYKRGDYATAARINRRMADQGLAPAQTVLGLAYHYGQGVQHDEAEAVKWFRKGAEQGWAQAEFYLARSYENGVGIQQNYAEAVKWYRKAADQGHADAQNGMGLAYLGGQGVPQDYTQSVKWFRKSAEQGDANGQWMLGRMYQDGRGVARNYVLAYMWTNIAVGRVSAAEDRDAAVKFRNSIAIAMSPTQIAYAQQISQTCLDSNYTLCDPTAMTGVPLKTNGNTLLVPVELNGTMTLDFVIDSGASDVSIPADVFSTLKRTSSVKLSDLTGQQTYVLADGSKVQSVTFIIRSLRVGNILLKDVRGSVAPSQASLLLGQSFLERFKSWSIDNTKKELFLETQ